MGIFSKKRVEGASTTTDVAESGSASGSGGSPTRAGEDPEKYDGRNTITQQHKDVPPSARHYDAALEKRVVRKIDRNLVPLLAVLYLLAYLDRSNIGNARIAGMAVDLNLKPGQYEWFLTIFYIPYILFEPFGLMWKVVAPHKWAAFTVMGWAVCGTLQAATYSWSGMMAARFFLGVFEASFAPGIPFLLSFFYARNELGLRCGMFLSAAPLAICFAGALAYGITSGDPKGIASWRLLFLVEGLPCVVASVATWYLMPDTPEKARFLNEEEKACAKARSLKQVGSDGESRMGKIIWKDVGATLMDIKPWITGLMYFSCNVSFASLPVFLPTILREMGFTKIHAQGLSAPPYFLAFLVVIATTYYADKTSQRGLTIMGLSLIGAIGYIMLATASTTAIRYTGVYFAAAGIFPAIGNILPWVLNNQGSDTRRGTGIAMLNVIGQCGPLLGTRLYPLHEGPYYRKGMWVCASFMLFNGFLAFALRCLLQWENKKLDEKYGVVEDMGEDDGLGNENEGPRFRFIL
ncbi:related to nicotinamide mononucleotide permease [Rhynchosporium secalis]|uniref:Related to nicotinamide mononucleotide permease n=1 Tax=Rhynchosporium secalis TaxID=38038 RepID=A0A1E1MSR1_RHYSE|nr:related to nicotinamide mononucleotide permease [Rhynchosporium secalis]